MAKYKKRPDGRYATSTIVGYTDDGKPKRKTLYGRTIMELDKKVAEFKSLQNKGIIINDEGMTVEQWCKKWLELYKADKAYNTYLMYQNALNTHIIPNLGNIRLNALKSHHIQELLNSIIRDGHHRTAEIVKITIKQIIQQAIINEYIYKDISLGLTLPNKKKPKKRALTDAEKKLIFKADFNSMERVFIDLLYYTGIRKGEALSLTVSDIDFINKKISISKNLVMQYRSSTIKPSPKTQAGHREIQNIFSDALEKLNRRRRKLQMGSGQVLSGALGHRRAGFCGHAVAGFGEDRQSAERRTFLRRRHADCHGESGGQDGAADVPRPVRRHAGYCAAYHRF